MSVYKYTNRYYYNKNGEKVDKFKDIFENNKLWFSSPLNFNDPFELKPNIKQIVDNEYHPLVSEFNKQLNAIGRVHEVFYDTIKPMLGSIGILCLSGVKDHLAMWAHYADNHNGIVIEFAKEHLFFKNKFKPPKDSIYGYLQPLTKVKYTEERRSINSNEYPSEEDFLTKSNHWEYEEEYRMGVMMNDDPIDEDTEILAGIPVTFPNDLITTIYLGQNADRETSEYFFNLRKTDEWKHLKIFKMNLDEQHYQLNPQEMK